DKAAAIAIKYVPNTALELMITGLKQLADLKVYGLDGGISAEQIQKTQDALKAIKKLTNVLKPEGVAKATFVQQAVKGLGGLGVGGGAPVFPRPSARQH